MSPEMLLDSEPGSLATAVRRCALDSQPEENAAIDLQATKELPRMLLSSLPVMTQEHFSEHFQGGGEL